MMRKVLLLVIACLLTSLAWAETEEFNWRGPVSAGQEIEIKGINGNIEATYGSGDVQVRAVKTGRRDDPAEVRIEVVEHSGGVTICAVYPNPGRRPNECEPGKGGRNSVRKNDVQVNFFVQVPSGVNFVGRTVNGDVEAVDLAADASAHTVNGQVDISCEGSGQAHTVNGSIYASFGRPFDDDVNFSTVNGSVTLEVPGDLDAEVRASSVNGRISSDFPLSIEGRWGPQKARGTIGNGSVSLAIRTVNGSIEIREGRRSR